MIIHKDYGTILNIPFKIEIYSDSELRVNQKIFLPNSNILQNPFDEFYLLAQRFQNNLIDRDSKLVIKLDGPPYFFYFILKKIYWHFDLAKIDFECTFTEKQNNLDRDFMISKMTDFVLKVTEKNLSEISYLFCQICNTQKKYYPIGINPGIDIVIPVKNTDIKDLMTCMESLEPQIASLDRIFLIDDNDLPTLSLETFERFDFNIQLIRGSVNGIGAARNTGSKSGKNPLVLFVDSDDYVLPGFVFAQRSFLERHSEIGASGTWLQAFGSHERFFPQWDNISPLSVLSCLPPAGVLMWKRAALEELDFFNPDFQVGFEDFDLVARATVQSIPIIVLDEVLYRYRRGHRSLSQNWNSDQELELRNSVNANLKNLCPHDFKSFLDLNTKYGPSIFQANPDYVFGKQELKSGIVSPFIISILFLLSKILLSKKTRRFISRVFGKLFPNVLNYVLAANHSLLIVPQIRRNKLVIRTWGILPSRVKLFFFRRFFS